MRILLLLLMVCQTVQANISKDLSQRAESGDINAQRALAEHYEHGDQVSANVHKAIHWYCKAALQNDVKAQQAIGWIYMNGRGVSKNDAIAHDWLQRAAKQGDAYAKRMLTFLEPEKSKHKAICQTPIDTEWVSRCPKNQKHCKTIFKVVEQLAPKFNLDPNFVLSIIMVESRFNPHAKSPKNAQGLMQLIPGTANRFKVKQVFSIKDNLKGGMAYLQWLLAYYKGNVEWTAAAYNAGEGAVDRYKGIPRYRETQQYVKKIIGYYGKTKHSYRKNWIEASKILTN